MPVEVREPVPTPLELARRVISPAISPLETAFIVCVVTVVILLQRDDLRDRAICLFGSGDLHRTTTLMDEAAWRLRSRAVFDRRARPVAVGHPRRAAAARAVRRHLDRGRAGDGAGRCGGPCMVGGRHGQVE